MADNGARFCSATCKSLYFKRSCKVAIPKEALRNLKYLQTRTGESRMDLIRRAIGAYTKKYKERFNLY